MKIVAFFSQKGGSGKSVLSIHTAVAAGAKEKVVLIDCDPQGTSATWSLEREKVSPVVAKASPGNIKEVLKAAEQDGYTLAVLDCPPHAVPGTIDIVKQANYVIIPIQPSMPDLAAASRAISMVEAAGKRFSFVINRAPFRAPEIEQAMNGLRTSGSVCPVVIGDRRSFSRALTDSLAVTEFDRKDSKAVLEIAQFWRWLNKELKK